MNHPVMPPEYAAEREPGHDTGDEDPGEPAQRFAIRCERQAWKADTFWARYAMPMGMRDVRRANTLVTAGALYLDPDEVTRRVLEADAKRRG